MTTHDWANGIASITCKSSKSINSDFVLLIELEQLTIPKFRIEFDEISQTYATMILFMPDTKINVKKREAVFIIDAALSGGKQGLRNRREAKNALQMCIRSLEPETPFNVFTLDWDYTKLYRHSEALDSKGFSAATLFIEDWNLTSSNTQLVPVLKSIYAKDPQTDFRNIFLFTSGNEFM